MAEARNRVDCLGLGIMPLDLLFEVDSYPGPGAKRDARRLTVQGGGPVPNVLVGLKRLGCSVALVATIADDAAGQTNIEELRKEGIDPRHLIVKKTGVSDVAAGYVERSTGRRTIVLHKEIGIRAAEIKLKTLPLPRTVHLDGRDLEACIKVARWAHRQGAQVVFDVGSIRNDVSPIFPYVDHLVVADAFALPFTKSRTARQAVEKLRELCPGTVVVSEGTKGSVGVEGGHWSRQAAFKVDAVDTTGAGDAFHTGYIYGLLHDWSLAKRLHFGAATAALKCTRPGARAGAPRLSEVRRFIKSGPKQYA